jgi:putative aminopeptidase FrvX
MNKELLIEILSQPTFFGREEKIKKFLINYFKEKMYAYHLDKKGNLYVQKGNTEFFPCVTAHLDSVHQSAVYLIEHDLNKTIIEHDDRLYARDPVTNVRIGIAGDDLCGVYLCLEMLERVDNLKVAFFVEEEFGVKGAQQCDKDFLKDVGYFIAFDGPTANWYTETLDGLPIYSEDFHNEVKGILKTHGITNFSHDPYTDIVVVRDLFEVSSCNLPAAYFKWHSKEEYVDLNYMDNCISLGVAFLNKLGCKKYPFFTWSEMRKKIKQERNSFWKNNSLDYV